MASRNESCPYEADELRVPNSADFIRDLGSLPVVVLDDLSPAVGIAVLQPPEPVHQRLIGLALIARPAGRDSPDTALRAGDDVVVLRLDRASAICAKTHYRLHSDILPTIRGVFAERRMPVYRRYFHELRSGLL